jgi:hypothetical protein
MPKGIHPITLLVPPSSAEPMDLCMDGYGLRMVVVSKESLGLLDSTWDERGVYFLLGRSTDLNKYTAYVGKASRQGLRRRVAEHVRTKERWDRALLISSTDGLDSAAIGWLEGRFYDVLQNAAAADILNHNQPRDESVPQYRRDVLERYVEPVMAVLRALGASPDTADQASVGAAADRTLATRKRHFKTRLADLIAGGLLVPGETLFVLRKRVGKVEAILRADGHIDVSGRSYSSPSAAAKAVSGTISEPGWEYWAIRRDGKLISLYNVRSNFLESSVTAA